jgi:antitoxin ParD1/3/4
MDLNISLPETLQAYVEAQVSQGEYETVNAYFHELVQQDQRRKAQEKLETMLIDGLNSGDGAEVTIDFWKNLKSDVLGTTGAD